MISAIVARWPDASTGLHGLLAGVTARYNSSFEYDANVNSTTYSPRETNSYDVVSLFWLASFWVTNAIRIGFASHHLLQMSPGTRL